MFCYVFAYLPQVVDVSSIIVLDISDPAGISAAFHDQPAVPTDLIESLDNLRHVDTRVFVQSNAVRETGMDLTDSVLPQSFQLLAGVTMVVHCIL